MVGWASEYHLRSYIFRGMYSPLLWTCCAPCVAQLRKTGLDSSLPGSTHCSLCSALNMTNDYISEVLEQLAVLRFRKCVLRRAQLSASCESSDLALSKPRPTKQSWMERIWSKGQRGLTFSLDPHDEAGVTAQALHGPCLQRTPTKGRTFSMRNGGRRYSRAAIPCMHQLWLRNREAPYQPTRHGRHLPSYSAHSR